MNILDILKGTPWWVYVVCLYILFIGIRSTKYNDVPIAKLLVLPILFLWLGIDALVRYVNVTTPHVSVWLVGIIIGAGVGAWQYVRIGISINRENKTVGIPGNYSTLVFVLLIFFIKYYYGYKLAIDPHIVENDQFVFTMLFVSGFLSGTFVGRLLYALKKMFLTA